MTGEQVKRVTVEEPMELFSAREVMRAWKWAIPDDPESSDEYDNDLDAFEAAVREDERERARVLVSFIEAFLRAYPSDPIEKVLDEYLSLTQEQP